MLLDKKNIEEELKSLSGWEYENNSLIKLYQLKDFSSALAFTVKAGIESEKMDHHPDIFIHGWNKVKITLSTHSDGGVTDKDISLAAIFNKL